MEVLGVIGAIIGLILAYLFLRKFGGFLLNLVIGIAGIWGIYKGFTLGGGWWIGGGIGAIAALIGGFNVVNMIQTGEYNTDDIARRMARDEYIQKQNAENEEGSEEESEDESEESRNA